LEKKIQDFERDLEKFGFVKDEEVFDVFI